MMPESWTARGALLVTLAVAAVLVLALVLGLPPAPGLEVDPLSAAEAWAARSSYVQAWMAGSGTLLGIAAAAWGVYGARNLPTAHRAATTSERLSGWPAPARGVPTSPAGGTMRVEALEAP